MKKYIILNLLLLITFISNIEGQTINGITPQDPQVRAIQRYDEVPVGTYTGIPAISYPLVGLKSGGLNYSLSLSYHAGGVRVSDQATNVGLGWSLNNDIVLTVSPIGKVDSNPNLNYSEEDVKNLIKIWDEFSLKTSTNQRPSIKEEELWECDTDSYPDEPRARMRERLEWGDFQPDMYSISSSMLNLRFMKDFKTNQWVILEGDRNCQISHNSTNDTWEIIDSNGTTFNFDNVEFRKNSNLANSIPSWRIDSIFSYDNHFLIFTYEDESQDERAEFDEYKESNSYEYRVEINPLSFYNTAAKNYVETKTENYLPQISGSDVNFKSRRLSKVRSSFGSYILFDYDSIRRSDLQYNSGDSAYALKEIIKYDRNNSKLSSISLDNDEYFDSDNSSSTNDYLEKRLKLSGYSKKGSSSSIIENYTFEYEEDISLPKKNSKAVDYWGFYNGENNTYLFPNLLLLNRLNNFPRLKKTQGGNRGTDEDGRYKAWSLKRINLPTGGAIEYDFEAHRFNNFIMPSRQEMKEGSISSMIEYKESGLGDGSLKSSIYELDDNDNIELQINISFGTGTILAPNEIGAAKETAISSLENAPGSNGDIFQIESIDENDKTIRVVFRWNPDIGFLNDFKQDNRCYASRVIRLPVLTRGRYKVTRWFPGTNLNYNISFDAYPKNVYPELHESIGGGMRVKSISYFDQNDSLTKKIDYTYTTDNGINSGKLIKIPLFYNTRYLKQGITDVSTQTTSRSFLVRSKVVDQNGSETKSGEDEYEVKVFDVNSSFTTIGISDFFYEKRTISSSSYTTTMPGSSGAIVGYSSVSINYSDGGKQTIDYYNEENTGLNTSSLWTMNDRRNGLILSEKNYNAKNELLDLTEYNYQKVDNAIPLIFLSVMDNYNGPECENVGMVMNNHLYRGRWILSLNAFNNYFTQTTRVINKSFSKNKSFTNFINYYYDDYFQVSEVEKKSQDKLYSTLSTVTNKYPYDEIDGYDLSVKDSLMNSNRISQPLEIVEKQKDLYSLYNSSYSSNRKRINFSSSLYDGKRLVDNISTYHQKSEDSNEKLISEYKVVKRSNNFPYHILEETDKSGVHYCYLYGYKKSGDTKVYLPIAKIIGATYDKGSIKDINNNEFTSSKITSLESFTGEVITDALKAVQTNLPAAQIELYAYKEGFGISEKMDTNGKLFTYKYDTAGRLIEIKEDGNVISAYDYKLLNR